MRAGWLDFVVVALLAACRSNPASQTSSPGSSASKPEVVEAVAPNPGTPVAPPYHPTPPTVMPSPPTVTLEARLACEHRVHGTRFKPCEYDARGGTLPTIAPGDRLWLEADAPAEARVYVVGLDSRNTFTPLGHWPALGNRATAARAVSSATEIDLEPGRKVPSTVLVIASQGIIKVLEGEDRVACEGNPASTSDTCGVVDGSEAR